MSCSHCIVEERRLVKDFTYWRVELFENQSYLGRCSIVLKRHLEDAFDCTDEELKELIDVCRKLKAAFSLCFKPDLFNYAFLGNVERHVQLHFVPRYAAPRSFSEVKFFDDRFGKSYMPAREFAPPTRILQALREELLKGL